MTEREELSNVIRMHIWQNVDDEITCSCGKWRRGEETSWWNHMSEVILASDWLGEHDENLYKRAFNAGGDQKLPDSPSVECQCGRRIHFQGIEEAIAEGRSDMRAQMAALCRLLVTDGHMTPIATRQIMKVLD